MAATVRPTESAQLVLQEADSFLRSDPVRHNVILTLLHKRVANPSPGRYWVVDLDGRTAGVAFQSPLDFPATVTPMPREAATATVDAIVDQRVRLPGVNGEAATTARFAGHWTERTKSAARPVQGQRIYEVDVVRPGAPVSGRVRPGRDADRELLVRWFEDFGAATGDSSGDAAEVVDLRLAAGQLWVWDDDGPMAMAGLSAEVAGVVRVGPVYTPPERRGRGYASALVGATSGAVRAQGHRCILYTDLGNPTSNGIYRALGYLAVEEALKYMFDDPR